MSASPTWRRARTVAASVDDILATVGGGPYVAREVDTALENALGGEQPVVVVTGERLAGSTRALARAMRLMLGDRPLLHLADPHHVDLADALSRARAIARRRGPVVVVADDAPPALLDQITPATTDLLDADVRLLLTTRQRWLDAFLDPGTRALLDGSSITVPPLSASEARGRFPDAAVGVPLGAAVRPVRAARGLLDPGTDAPLRRAVLRAVIDWELLGAPTALTRTALADLVPLYLRSADPRRARREIRRLLRRDVDGLRPLRRRRRSVDGHLVVDPVLSSVADAEPTLVGPPPSPSLVRRESLTDVERRQVARVAFERGLGTTGLWVTGELGEQGFAPAAALCGAQAWVAVDQPPGSDDRARMWFTRAIEYGDDDVVRQAVRGLGLLDHRRHRVDQAYPLLVEAADDDQYVQSVLATITLERGDPVADHWLALTATGPDEPMASTAAITAGTRALDTDRLDDAERFLTQASGASDVDVRAQALVLLAAIARRRGRRGVAADRFGEVMALGRPEDLVQRAALELAQLRREATDVEGEIEALRAAIRSSNPATFEAQVELAEVEVGRERWQDVLDLLPPHDDAFRGHDDDRALRERRDAAMGEAAFRLGRWSVAQMYLRGLADRADRVGALARLRLGQVEIELGNVLDGYRLLVPMQRSGEADLAEQARTLAGPLEAEAQRLAKQEASAGGEAAAIAFA